MSTPVAWTELSASKLPGRFTMTTVVKRLSTLHADPWKASVGTRQRIARGATRALERL